jgi:DNA-directed RNA polymerase specialized sigma24 family protein
VLFQIVEQMSGDCRDLWRSIAAGQSYRQMSRQLGVSEGALRVRVLRCRRRALEIRESLKGQR